MLLSSGAGDCFINLPYQKNCLQHTGGGTYHFEYQVLRFSTPYPNAILSTIIMRNGTTLLIILAPTDNFLA